MVLYYEIIFLISLFLTMVYAYFWNKRFDVHFTLMFGLMPIANLGYVLLAESESLASALIAQKIIYIGACFLILLIMLCIFTLCRIKMNKAIHSLLILISTIMYIGALTMGKSELFYKSVDFVIIDDVVVLHKHYGILHHLFYAMLIVYMLMSVGGLAYSLNKKDVSNKMIYLMFIPEIVTFICFFGGRMIKETLDLVPLCFLFSQIVFLVIIHRVCLYDIDDTVADSLVQNGTTGFISFDLNLNYLASNETAKRIFPELNDMVVDKPVDSNGTMKATILEWIDRFKRDKSQNKVCYKTNGQYYIVEITNLYNGQHIWGYQFYLTDDTQNQQYIALIGRYNTDLKNEVADKTRHIVEMHDKLIMSLAVMVESRDNSTGGHIKRSSEVVKILIGEIITENEFQLTDSFCRNLIKAAPMHDLGKIAVDDAILRKPGRFTDEEYEKMKAHAAEGARIVHEILDGTDDFEFHVIAENVAHYHHERWDGSGYPENLKGDQIPLEARIMAIADVYDALVSKRVYKEKMSFEKADSIIMDGMGKHFDKRLEKYYVSARPKLEAYYSELD